MPRPSHTTPKPWPPPPALSHMRSVPRRSSSSAHLRRPSPTAKRCGAPISPSPSPSISHPHPRPHPLLHPHPHPHPVSLNTLSPPPSGSTLSSHPQPSASHPLTLSPSHPRPPPLRRPHPSPFTLSSSKALELNPDSAKTYKVAAKALTKMGDFAGAYAKLCTGNKVPVLHMNAHMHTCTHACIYTCIHGHSAYLLAALLAC